MGSYCINAVTKFGAQPEEFTERVCKIEGGSYPAPSDAVSTGKFIRLEFGAILVHWNPNSSHSNQVLCTVLTKSISRVDASYRFLTLEKEALRSKRGAESVAT